ncbi:hypothetical protein [uncultured Nocardioides sp.]|uniref:hypothetical protein n=1 Tax=uncultured Nocardioides sp. TaxID=198441 RepID=UPI002609FAE1|nr:hypothetical protein [uncultured Nocardioides sp.]
MTSPRGSSLATRVARATAVLAGLLLPVALIAPVAAETQVVRDDERPGHLKSMTVKRGPERLEIVTSFDAADDLHQFRLRRPGSQRVVFRVVWRSDTEETGRVTVNYVYYDPYADEPPPGLPDRGERTCDLRDGASWRGPEATRLVVTVPNRCLQVRKGIDVPRLSVSQKASQVRGGVHYTQDRLGPSRHLTTR